MKRLYNLGAFVFISLVICLLSLNSQHQTADDGIILTVVTANDGHWRPPEVNSKYHLLNQIMMNAINDRGDVDLVIFNGDLVDRYAYIDWWNVQHPDDPITDRESRFNITWLYGVKEVYEQLEMPFYAVQGNHDRATWEFWEKVWGYPANHHFTVQEYAFVLLTRHDDRLVYHSVDYEWLEEVLSSYDDKLGIFIFIHAGDSDVVNNEFQDFIEDYPHVRCIFFGHNHRDRMENINGVYYFWNGNFMNTVIDFGYRVMYIYESGKIETYFNRLGLRSGQKTNYVLITPTNQIEYAKDEIPQHFKLYQNYPNPFNPTTTISYSIPHQSDVTVSVFNLLGQKVDTIVNERHRAGYYQIAWTPPAQLSSGVYMYTLEARDVDELTTSNTKLQKMILLR